MSTFFVRAFALLWFVVAATALRAQAPQILNYQGRVAVGTTNFSGSGLFKFALVDGTGATTYWSNDGTSTGGSQPTAAVTLTVTSGLYSVLLGNTALANMTVVPNAVFNNADVRLRVWFNDGPHGFQLLTPDQRLAAVGYAMMAGGVNLPDTTSASVGVVNLGGNPFLHDYGRRGWHSQNTFVGAAAGNFTMNGESNTAIGTLSLSNNTFGIENVALGDVALFANTGIDNTAAGSHALWNNTRGGGNTAAGAFALGNNTTGSGNIGIGEEAGVNLTTGELNIAIGNQAGQNLTTGNFNIDIGSDGMANDTNIIRIGDGSRQTDTFLAGIIHGDGSGLTNLTLGSTTTVSGLNLPLTTSATTGVLDIGGSPFLHAYGVNNTFVGGGAGNFTMTGGSNTATGYLALTNNTMGSNNTATGYGTLNANSTGSANTATGYSALTSNTTGGNNTATGYSVLTSNTTGSDNTATGFLALTNNTTGSNNTASGYGALVANTAATDNAAFGSQALNFNTTAGQNVAVGSGALFNQAYNNSGTPWSSNNVAVGYQALYSDQPTSTATGSGNTALGYFSLHANTTGSNNIAVGTSAGASLTTGSNNIDIGHPGNAGEANTIRIGTSGTQTTTFIAGVAGVTSSGGAALFINTSGQLGTTTSSRRFKQNIQPMGASSDCLLALHPVTFQYKPELDPKGLPQWGLIAEEVNEVNPALVVRDDQGQIQTVRYEQVNAMLLNEFLKEHQRVESLQSENAEMKKQLDELKAKERDRDSLQKELSARLTKLEQFVPAAPKSSTTAAATTKGE